MNEIPGVVHVGELHYLWRNFLNKGTNTQCGCGASLATCPLWSQVLAVTAAGKPVTEYATTVVPYQTCVRTRYTWRVLRYQRGRDRCLDAYADILARTYHAIQAATGANIIVDGGKYPAEAALLPHLPGIRPVYLHLVRDPRASAFSWSQVKDYIPAMPVTRSTGYWVGFNLASDAIRQRYPDSSLFLRYEDFIADPHAHVNRMLTLLGLDHTHNPLQGRTVTLGANHTVTGNPDRFATGQINVRPHDDDWRKKFPRQSQLVTTLLALPVMHRYGY